MKSSTGRLFESFYRLIEYQMSMCARYLYLELFLSRLTYVYLEKRNRTIAIYIYGYKIALSNRGLQILASSKFSIVSPYSLTYAYRPCRVDTPLMCLMHYLRKNNA